MSKSALSHLTLNDLWSHLMVKNRVVHSINSWGSIPAIAGLLVLLCYTHAVDIERSTWSSVHLAQLQNVERMSRKGILNPSLLPCMMLPNDC